MEKVNKNNALNITFSVVSQEASSSFYFVVIETSASKNLIPSELLTLNQAAVIM